MLLWPRPWACVHPARKSGTHHIVLSNSNSNSWVANDPRPSNVAGAWNPCPVLEISVETYQREHNITPLPAPLKPPNQPQTLHIFRPTFLSSRKIYLINSDSWQRTSQPTSDLGQWPGSLDRSTSSPGPRKETSSRYRRLGSRLPQTAHAHIIGSRHKLLETDPASLTVTASYPTRDIRRGFTPTTTRV